MSVYAPTANATPNIKQKEGTKATRRDSGKIQHAHLCSVCVRTSPTAKATTNTKQNLFSDVQDTLDRIPLPDVLIMLGDFNERVGTLGSTSVNNNWGGTIGKHGLRERSEASEDLLEL